MQIVHRVDLKKSSYIPIENGYFCHSLTMNR